MRIEDIYNYSEPLNEAPYGTFQNMKDTVATKFGSQEARGNQESGIDANALYQEFRKYVGQVVGTGKKYIEAEHLIDFLNSKGKNSNIGKKPSDMITPAEAQTLIMNSARTSKRFKSPTSDTEAQKQQSSQAQPKVANNTNPSNVDDITSMISNLSSKDRAKLLQFLQQ